MIRFDLKLHTKSQASTRICQTLAGEFAPGWPNSSLEIATLISVRGSVLLMAVLGYSKDTRRPHSIDALHEPHTCFYVGATPPGHLSATHLTYFPSGEL